MTQICVDCFDRVGFLFIGSHFIRSAIIQSVIAWESVTVILFGLRSTLQTGLQCFGCSMWHNIPTQHTARIPIHYCEYINFVFFSPTKVYSSSSSAFLTLLGTGAGGSLLVYWLTQLATLCGLTFRIRAIEP
jgi:hypothetical protein